MAQNNIPTDFATTIDNLNQQFANFVERVDSCKVPNVVKTIIELGVENVFYIQQIYKGLYDDDYCDFYYWDNVNGKVINDHWTTACGCPAFDTYIENIFTFDEATQMGLVNMDLLKKYNIEKALNYIESIQNLKDVNSIIKENNPLVKVEGGRKFKGIGYYVDTIDTSKSLQYNNIEARILSLEDFQIHYCSPQYVQLINTDEVVENYIKWATDILNKVVLNNSYATFFNMTGVYWTIRDENFSFEAYVKAQADPIIKYLIENAYDPKEEELKKKHAEKMTKKYNDILNWVKTKTGVTEENAQIALAIRILNKNI